MAGSRASTDRCALTGPPERLSLPLNIFLFRVPLALPCPSIVPSVLPVCGVLQVFFHQSEWTDTAHLLTIGTEVAFSVAERQNKYNGIRMQWLPPGTVQFEVRLLASEPLGPPFPFRLSHFRRPREQTTGEVKDAATAADLGRIEAAAGVVYQFGMSDISDGYGAPMLLAYVP